MARPVLWKKTRVADRKDVSVQRAMVKDCVLENSTSAQGKIHLQASAADGINLGISHWLVCFAGRGGWAGGGGDFALVHEFPLMLMLRMYFG